MTATAGAYQEKTTEVGVFASAQTGSVGGMLTFAATREVPSHEQWLARTPSALQSVMRGLVQSAQGLTVELGSFAQYADLDLDDE